MLKQTTLALGLLLSTQAYAVDCDKVSRITAFAGLEVATNKQDAGKMLAQMRVISTKLELSNTDMVVALGLYSTLLTEDIDKWYSSLPAAKGDENKVVAAYNSIADVCDALFPTKREMI